MSETFESKRAAEPVGAFPHAKRVGNLLFLSGIGPRVRGSKEIPGVTLDSAGNITSYDIEAQIAEGDKVVTRLTSYGKHEGDLPGAPRTGNDLKMTSITIHRIENGKLAEKWSEKDMLGLLTQIGVLHPPGQHGG